MRLTRHCRVGPRAPDLKPVLSGAPAFDAWPRGLTALVLIGAAAIGLLAVALGSSRLPQMADETARRYVFVAIDRATRWVYIAIKRQRTALGVRSFLNASAKAAPFKIRTILTDNGTEFTDR